MTHFVRRLILACFPLLLLATWSLPAQAAASPKAKAPARPLCVVHSNPSMVEAGEFATESSIADVIQVECRPVFSQQFVVIDATQLFNQCRGSLFWLTPPAIPLPALLIAPQFEVQLDNNGNATAVVFGGPSCAPAKATITASLLAPPFPTVKTTFTILPPVDTPHGVTASPKSEVEDAVFSSIATVVQVEFPSSQAERFVTIKSDELFSRCAGNLVWLGPGGAFLGIGPESLPVQLDNNGNAFVVAVGGPSCASGTSTITAELTTVPFTTFSTNFTILSPRPTV